MEHIPIPHHLASPRPKVPVHSPPQNDSLGFDGFPERNGFDQSRLLRGDFSQHPPQQTAAFLQTWLYFGTLHEVLGPEYGVAELFVVPDEDFEHGVVTTVLLEDLFCKRIKKLQSLFYDKDPHTCTQSGQVAWQTYYTIKSCLRKLLTFCSLATVAEDTRDFPARWPLLPVVDLSLRVMGHYLTACLYCTLLWVVPSDTTLFRFPVAYFSIEQMVRAYWCPSEVTMLTESYSPCTLHYTSELSRKNSKLDHSSCSKRLCHARQVRSDYTTKHVADGCDCLHIGPDLDKVLSIIKEKRIPLITIGGGKTGQKVSLDVEAYNGKQNYIAFSHVWSDGLGNPRGNTLPRCQLFRLKNLLSNLSSLSSTWHLINTADVQRLYRRVRDRSVSFWLDTLCIPAPGTDHDDERVTALQLMKDTYEKSYQVLILDSEVEASYQYSSMESFLRVSVAGWMRRLWTLQEGVLGQRLYVKFRDGFFNLEVHGHRSDTRPTYDNPRSMIYSAVAPSIEVKSMLMKMRFLRASFVDKPERKMVGVRQEIVWKNASDEDRAKRSTNTTAIFEAFKASVYRSSSREADEFTCMASLLGWNFSSLKDIPMDDRMHHLLSQQRYLPEALIFMAGTRMKRKGWTWAINRFGSRAAIQIDPHMTAAKDGTVTGEGFLVGCPALVLPKAYDIRLYDDVIIGFSTGDTNLTGYMRITRHKEFEDGGSSEKATVTKSQEAETEAEASSYSAARLAINPLVSYVILYHSYYDPPVQSVVSPAAVISVATKKHGELNQCNTKGVFEHLAKLEYLGADWAEVDVLLQRRNSPVMLLQEQARLLHRTWCVQ